MWLAQGFSYDGSLLHFLVSLSSALPRNRVCRGCRFGAKLLKPRGRRLFSGHVTRVLGWGTVFASISANRLKIIDLSWVFDRGGPRRVASDPIAFLKAAASHAGKAKDVLSYQRRTDGPSVRGHQLESRTFFSPNCHIELAGHAVGRLLRECALNLSAAKRPRKSPANPASMGPVVEAAHVCARCRAGAEFGHPRAPRLATAFLDLPAVRSCCHGSCPPIYLIGRKISLASESHLLGSQQGPGRRGAYLPPLRFVVAPNQAGNV